MISVVSLMVGAAIAIGGAEAGYGYWALVWMSIASPLAGTLGLWLTTGWIPGMPQSRLEFSVSDAIRRHAHFE